jgi:hypothetical protein
LSKRFAPGGWTQSTKDNAITVNRRYLPFWNLSLHGSINASLKLAHNTTIRVCFILMSFSFIIKSILIAWEKYYSNSTMVFYSNKNE